MMSVPWVQISRIIRSPFYSPSSGGSASLPFHDVFPLASPPLHSSASKYVGVVVHVRGGWRPFLQGWRPHHGYHCDAPWWGLPYCSPRRGILRRPTHSHHNGTASQVAQCHSLGIGSTSILAPLTPSHWLLRGSLTATPLSAESTPAIVHPGSMQLPGTLPGKYPPPPHVSIVSPPYPPP